jgi:AhpD family alkylhydroperoxidase
LARLILIETGWPLDWIRPRESRFLRSACSEPNGWTTLHAIDRLVPRERDRRAIEDSGEPAPQVRIKETAMYDMKNLTKLKKMGELAPEAFKGFVAFDEAVFKDGAIPLKYKELMAVAVALTTQCPYCIEIHSKKAKKAGASEQELTETTLIAAALRAGAAVTHGTHALE